VGTRRILLLITDLELGGTPTVVRELALRLRSPDLQVEVACLAAWGPVATQLRDAGVTVTALGASSPRDLSILPRFIQLVRRGRFDTVFSSLVHANVIAAMAAIWLRDVRWMQSIQTTQPTPRWHWHAQRLAAHAADVMVVPSASVARCLREWSNVPAEKIVVIPNAIDLAEYTTAISKVPSSDPRPYPVAFLGRLDPIKAIPTLIDAVARVTPRGLVHLHVYGEGRDRPNVERAISAHRAGDLVTLHGSIDRPQTALVNAGLLALPSFAEGFGLVLIEAMAAGVPVVATDVPGICDVVRHEQTGLLVPVNDPASLAAAIVRIVNDRQLRERLIASASRDVRERFTWDRVIQQYRSLLGI
jgi:glycosyltransferase involved in cell wall biosynthesis